MRTGREGTWLVKHLQPWPPGCGQWGETPAPTYHLWATDSFSLTSAYTQSISGLFFWNWLIKPPSCSENEGNPSSHNPNNAAKSSSPHCWLSLQSPCSEEGEVPGFKEHRSSLPRVLQKQRLLGSLEPAPYSVFIPPPVSY